MSDMLGQVIEVSASQLTVALNPREQSVGIDRTSIGALVKASALGGLVIGVVNTLRTEPAGGRHVIVVDLLGELASGPDGKLRFARGVSVHPIIGTPVTAATAEDADLVYGQPASFHARIGTLYRDDARPAYLVTNDLLSKHFAIVGSTGSGKSCAVTVVLRALLGAHPCAHIVLLDPHNEYTKAFGTSAEVFDADNLQLPCWLLNFEELVAALVRGGTPEDQEAQTAILKESVTQARRKFAGDGPDTGWITVDTPVPFRIGDLIRIIDQAMSKLNKVDTSAPYMRLKSRLDSLNSDRRFNFMFSMVTKDSLAQVVGGLLRIPVNGKPLTIIDLSGVPSEIVDVVVSLLCRVIFDFALWAEHGKMPPVLLVCEEAHRYVPADPSLGFAATTRAIARISKEGRKYGVSLGLITQRPSELSPSVLTQCGTVFALRMSNELDQQFVGNSLPESSLGMLAALPSLRRQEAVVVGEGVTIPMRIRFDTLPPEHRPRSTSAPFSQVWQKDTADAGMIEEGVRRWRHQLRDRPAGIEMSKPPGLSVVTPGRGRS
jgi:DNA helicase HerA-like ATPase